MDFQNLKTHRIRKDFYINRTVVRMGQKTYSVRLNRTSRSVCQQSRKYRSGNKTNFVNDDETMIKIVFLHENITFSK